MAKAFDMSPNRFEGKPQIPEVIKPKDVTGVPGVKGKIPLRAGEVILTPGETARLKRLGWKPGDPIPGQLPSVVKKMREEQKGVKDEIATTPPVPLDTPPTRIPEPIDISQLDAVKRQELEAYLQDFKVKAPQIEQAVKDIQKLDTLNPSVQKALVADMNTGIEVYDSRPSSSDLTETYSAHTEEAVKATTPVKPLDSVDYSDAANYVACVMSLKPFTKTYSFFGDKLQVMFRQLSTVQSERIMSEVVRSAKEGVTPAEIIRLGKLYRFILSTCYICANGCPPEAIAPDDDQSLPIALRKAMEGSFSNESVWRVCQDAFDKFTALIEELEAKADDPDFWKRIAG